MAQNSLPIPIDRHVHIRSGDWAKARNIARQIPNHIPLFETHWTLLSKGLSGPIPVISHAFLSLGISFPCVHLCMIDFSML